MSEAVEVSFETVCNGEILTEANAKLAEIIEDVIDRPHCTDARTVTLKIGIKPNIKQGGGNFPKIVCQVSTTRPGVKYDDSGMVSGDKLLLSTAIQTEMDLSPDNVEQFKKGTGEG